MKRTDKAVFILVACLSVAVLIFGGGIIIDIGAALAKPNYLDLRKPPPVIVVADLRSQVVR